MYKLRLARDFLIIRQFGAKRCLPLAVFVAVNLYVILLFKPKLLQVSWNILLSFVKLFCLVKNTSMKVSYVYEDIPGLGVCDHELSSSLVSHKDLHSPCSDPLWPQLTCSLLFWLCPCVPIPKYALFPRCLWSFFDLCDVLIWSIADKCSSNAGSVLSFSNMAVASHEVTPDALPYYDQGYEEHEVREMVWLLSL